MSLIGGLISAGSSLLGGIVGAKASRDNTQDMVNAQRDINAENTALQREFAQNGIRWRVADAKAAGLHPLFALGGSGATFTPNAASLSFDNGGQHLARAIADAGQHIGRAVSAQETPEERNARMWALEGAKAGVEKDYAQAAYWRAMAAKAGQEALQAKPMPSSVVTGAYTGATSFPVRADGRGTAVESHPLYQDAVELKPDAMVSRSARFDGQTAGERKPAMSEFEFPGRFRMLLPANESGDVPEEIDAMMLPQILGANLERYGWRWIVDWIGYATGRSPAARDEIFNLERGLRGRGFFRKER